MDIEEKTKLFRQLCWDYNISPEDIEAVLKGKKKKAGHFTRENLFVRLLETYPWFTVIQLLEIDDIKDLLTVRVTGRLRSSALRKKYEFVRQRLHDIIQSAG